MNIHSIKVTWLTTPFILLFSLYILLAGTIIVLADPLEPDSGFGTNGFVLLNGPDYPDIELYGLALDAEDRIIVSGCQNGALLVARFMTDGTPDPTFDSDGVLLWSDPEWAFCGYRLALDHDGKIVVGGGAFSFIDWDLSDFIAFRLNPDGILDTTLNGIGYIQTSFLDADYALDVAIDANNKIILAGSSENIWENEYATNIIRYNPDGSLDTTFGNQGQISIPDDTTAVALEIDADNKPVVSTSEFNNVVPMTKTRIFRYQPDGTPDTTFNGTGLVTLNVGGTADLLIQPDGKLLAVGKAEEAMWLARLNPNGSLDSEFGSGGSVTLPLNGAVEVINAPTLDTNGHIYVVASQYQAPPTGAEYGIISRLNPSGVLDTTLGYQGSFVADTPGRYNNLPNLLIDPEGRLLIVGSTYLENRQGLIGRYLIQPAEVVNELVINGSFEQGASSDQDTNAAGWKQKVNDSYGRRCNTYENMNSYSMFGSCAIYLKGVATNTFRLKQVINPENVTGGTVTLAVWIETHSKQKGGTISAKVLFDDDTAEKLMLTPPISSDYAYYEQSLTVTVPVRKIKVQVKMVNGHGTLRVDAIQVLHRPVDSLVPPVPLPVAPSGVLKHG